MIQHSLPDHQRAASRQSRTIIGMVGTGIGLCGILGTFLVFMMAHDPPQRKIPSQSMPQWEIFGVNLEQDGNRSSPPESCRTMGLLYNLGGRSTKMITVKTQGPFTVSGCGGCNGIRLKPGTSCKVRAAPNATRNGVLEGVLEVQGFQGKAPSLQIGGFAYNLDTDEKN